MTKQDIRYHIEYGTKLFIAFVIVLVSFLCFVEDKNTKTTSICLGLAALLLICSGCVFYTVFSYMLHFFLKADAIMFINYNDGSNEDNNETLQPQPQLLKHQNHVNYFVLDGILYEQFKEKQQKIKRQLFEVPGMPDINPCTDAAMKWILSEYCTV
jgi:hypothetical protein